MYAYTIVFIKVTLLYIINITTDIKIKIQNIKDK